MPSTTSYKFGDVVLINFPFTNLHSTKKRPAVVINCSAYARRHQDLIVMAITSQVRQPLGFGECLITEWDRAGLLKLSTFKPLIATIEQAGVLRTLGTLTSHDSASLLTLLRAVLDPA